MKNITRMKRAFQTFACSTYHRSYTTAAYILNFKAFILLINAMNMVSATTILPYASFEMISTFLSAQSFPVGILSMQYLNHVYIVLYYCKLAPEFLQCKIKFKEKISLNSCVLSNMLVDVLQPSKLFLLVLQPF